MITKIAVRVCLIIVPVIGGVCLLALWIGTTMPTHLIIVSLYSEKNDNGKVRLLDVNRNTFVTYPYITVGRRTFWERISPNGRRMVIINNLNVFAWDIFTGKTLSLSHLLDRSSGCNSISFYWLNDNNHIIASCHLYGGAVKSHIVDFETNLIRELRTNVYIHDGIKLSPDLNWFAFSENGIIKIVEIDRAFEINITQQGIQHNLIGWTSDSDHLLIYSETTIEQYNINDHSWEVLASGIKIMSPARPRISSSGEWLMFVSQTSDKPQVHILNLFTKSPQIIFRNVYGVDVSPDGLWFIVGPYLIRSDLSQISMAGNYNNVIWSDDGTRMIYGSLGEFEGFFNLRVLDVTTMSSYEFIPNNLADLQWSPDNNFIAFLGRQLFYTQDGINFRFLTPENLIVREFRFVR